MCAIRTDMQCGWFLSWALEFPSKPDWDVDKRLPCAQIIRVGCLRGEVHEDGVDSNRTGAIRTCSGDRCSVRIQRRFIRIRDSGRTDGFGVDSGRIESARADRREGAY